MLPSPGVLVLHQPSAFTAFTTIKMSRLLLVDDNDVIRMGLQHVLSNLANCEVVAQSASLESAAEALASTNIDIALIKFSMPDGEAKDFIPHVRREHPRTKVLLLLEEEEEFWQALEVDADGYEVRHMPSYQLEASLKALSDGYGWLGPMLSRYLLKRGGRQRLGLAARQQPINQELVESLSPREREVIGLLSEGRKGDEIADILSISPKTVKLHISSCIRKLNVEDRTQAIAKFLRGM
jgi:DNA-binding NarL/FixJ family response regulator